MAKISGVYRIVNKNNNKIYIGSSRDIEKRFKTHKWDLKAGRHANKAMQKDFNQGDTFIYEIIAKIPPVHEELFKNEYEITKEAKRSGASLYNAAEMCGGFYLDKRSIIEKMANKYCIEHLGITTAVLFNRRPAGYNMLFLEAMEPERAQEIEDYYKPAVEYQNKDDYYRRKYHIPYYKVLNMSEQERKELLKNGKGINTGSTESN